MNQHAKRRQASRRQAGHPPAGYLHDPAAAAAPEAKAARAIVLAPAAGGEHDYAVAIEHDGERIDRFLAAASLARGEPLSRTRLQALIAEGRVRVGDAIAGDASLRVKTGEAIVVSIPEPIAAEPQGEAIALAIVFEDEHLLVIDKPAGLVVHPAAGHATGTLVNALIAHCGASLSGIGGVRRPGIVHRLDKDTSGLLVVAKTDAAHKGLSLLFADHGRTLSLTREYIALLWGAPERMAGVIDAPLGRHPTHREKIAVVHNAASREAITHWRRVALYGAERDRLAVASLIACNLETGRTHQIRVHMAHIGCPVMGDPVYATGFRTKAAQLSPAASDALDALGRQALHAAILGFSHPITGQELMFESPPPADMQRLADALAAGN